MIAARVIDGQYEAVLTVGQKFSRSSSGQSLMKIVEKFLGPHFAQAYEDGTEIALSVNILTKSEVDRNEERTQQQKEVVEREQAVLVVERLNKVREREATARGQHATES